jgi:hypothetical protein
MFFPIGFVDFLEDFGFFLEVFLPYFRSQLALI